MRTALSIRPGIQVALLSVAIVGICGCSFTPASEEPVASATSESTQQPEDAPTANEGALNEAEGGADTGVNVGEPVEESLSYEPPFPERLELFLAPKREGRSIKNKVQEGNVELIGFANVEGREVVLSIIDGSVFSMAEGDVYCGVKVISIKQPAVVLQRGEHEKWQLTLSN